MVRRGSTVRVRQRALQRRNPRKPGIFVACPRTAEHLRVTVGMIASRRAIPKVPAHSSFERLHGAPPWYGGAPRSGRGLERGKSLEKKTLEIALPGPTNLGDRSWGHEQDENAGHRELYAGQMAFHRCLLRHQFQWIGVTTDVAPWRGVASRSWCTTPRSSSVAGAPRVVTAYWAPYEFVVARRP